MSGKMYGISVDGAIVSTVADKAIADTIATAVDGFVVNVSKQEANSFVKAATKVDSVPPRFAELLAEVKESILDEIADDVDSVWNFQLRYDGKFKVWHITVKDLSNGKPVWNLETGEKHNSIVHAIHSRGLAVATAYPMSKVKQTGDKLKSLFTSDRNKLAFDLKTNSNL